MSNKKAPKRIWRFNAFHPSAQLQSHDVEDRDKRVWKIVNAECEGIPNLWQTHASYSPHFKTGFRTKREAYDEAISVALINAQELLDWAKDLRSHRPKK